MGTKSTMIGNRRTNSEGLVMVKEVSIGHSQVGGIHAAVNKTISSTC
jgi:hypothetical protein